MGRIVIACYRPRPGMAAALRAMIRDHVATLRAEGLVTDRDPITMEARDGTIVEVFEWASAEAIAQAHDNPTVQKMWESYAAVCDYVPISQLSEAAELFAEFTPVECNRGQSAPRPGRAPEPARVPPPPPSRTPSPARPPRNPFGDPPDTLYAGGTPRFDETGGPLRRKPRR